MKVVAVVSDLMLFSRIESAARVAGAELARVDSPASVPPDANLILVDWSARGDDWAESLQSLRGPRVILFGPHVDLDAHAAAREAGLGPMWARSRVVAQIVDLLRDHATGSTNRNDVRADSVE